MSLATPACGEWMGNVCANNSPGSEGTETIVDAKDSHPGLFQARQRRGVIKSLPTGQSSLRGG